MKVLEEVDLVKVDTSDQVADISTKASSKEKLEKFMVMLGLISQVGTKGVLNYLRG